MNKRDGNLIYLFCYFLKTKKGEIKLSYTEKDYIKDTKKHIELVKKFMLFVASELQKRALVHDETKLHEPEKSIFCKHTPELDKCEYGSKEYKKHLDKVRVALDHHYANNSHHPEHYPNGIKGMNLLDVVEMFCDWYAVTYQHKRNTIEDSIEINKERFGYSNDLEAIFKNTVTLLDKSLEGDSDQAI